MLNCSGGGRGGRGGGGGGEREGEREGEEEEEEAVDSVTPPMGNSLAFQSLTRYCNLLQTTI